MPDGIVRTDLNSSGTSYKNGFPVTGPISYGNEVTEPHNFGCTIPPTFATSHSSPMTLPHNFGNQNPPVS
jgi:hypothetical protein